MFKLLILIIKIVCLVLNFIDKNNVCLGVVKISIKYEYRVFRCY